MIKCKGQGIVVGRADIDPDGKEGDVIVRYNSKDIIMLKSTKYILTQGLHPLRSGDTIEFTGVFYTNSLDESFINLTSIEIVKPTKRLVKRRIK